MREWGFISQFNFSRFLLMKALGLSGLKLRLNEVRQQLANLCPVTALIKSAVVEWPQTSRKTQFEAYSTVRG